MTEKIWVSKTMHHSLVFLKNEVLLAADPILALAPGNPWLEFTCNEAEQFACIFAAAGRQDVYDHIIHQHALADDEREVQFHLDMTDEGNRPPIPLGRAAAEEAERLRRDVNGEVA